MCSSSSRGRPATGLRNAAPVNITLAQSTVTIYEPDGTRARRRGIVGKFGLFVDPRTLRETGTYTMVVGGGGDAVVR